MKEKERERKRERERARERERREKRERRERREREERERREREEREREKREKREREKERQREKSENYVGALLRSVSLGHSYGYDAWASVVVGIAPAARSSWGNCSLPLCPQALVLLPSL